MILRYPNEIKNVQNFILLNLPLNYIFNPFAANFAVSLSTVYFGEKIFGGSDNGFLLMSRSNAHMWFGDVIAGILGDVIRSVCCLKSVGYDCKSSRFEFSSSVICGSFCGNFYLQFLAIQSSVLKNTVLLHY